MTSARRKLHTDRPDFTAALRTAAWRHHLADEDFSSRDLQELIQQARRDLGLAPLQGGAASDQLQRRTKGTVLYGQSDHPLHYEPRNNRLVPTVTVRNNWRFLNTPSHAEVRLVAREGHLQAGDVLTFTTRSSHLSSLTVLFGPIGDVRQRADQDHRDRRGLYLLRRHGKNYVGQTKEFGTRGRSHGTTGADLALFAFPNEAQRVSSDALNVAESLTITGFAEIFKIENPTLGHDALPQPHELREGAALALVFMAAVIRWAYEYPELAQDFMHWRTDISGLRDAYLSLGAYEGQP